MFSAASLTRAPGGDAQTETLEFHVNELLDLVTVRHLPGLRYGAGLNVGVVTDQRQVVAALPFPLVHPSLDVVRAPDLQEQRLLVVAATEPAAACRGRATGADRVGLVREGAEDVARLSLMASRAHRGGRIENGAGGCLRVRQRAGSLVEECAGVLSGRRGELFFRLQPEDVDVPCLVSL